MKSLAHILIAAFAAFDKFQGSQPKVAKLQLPPPDPATGITRGASIIVSKESKVS